MSHRGWGLGGAHPRVVMRRLAALALAWVLTATAADSAGAQAQAVRPTVTAAPSVEAANPSAPDAPLLASPFSPVVEPPDPARPEPVRGEVEVDGVGAGGTHAASAGAGAPDASGAVAPQATLSLRDRPQPTAAPGAVPGAVPGAATGSRALLDPRAPGVADLALEPVARPLRTSNGPVTLDGTLLLPPGDGPFPAVVLIADPGPDAKAKALPDAKLFAQAGIAAYAFDTHVASLPGADGPRGASGRDLVGDAVAAVKAVRRADGVDPERVGVWGVGEGGWVLPFVGAQEDVAFLILVNTATVPLGQLRQWQVGNDLQRAGAPPAAIGTTMRAMWLHQSAQPILARVLPVVAGGRPGLRGAGDEPGLSPTAALGASRAPILALYDASGSAPVVESAAALRAASRTRDQPYDVVTVLDQTAHALEGAQRADDAAYRTTVLAWTRSVLSDGATIEPLDPEAVRGMSRGFAPVAGRPAGSTPAASAAGRWYGGAGAPAPWYAGAWFQLPVLAFFVLSFTTGLVASLWRPPGAAAGLERRSPDRRRARDLLRLTQGLLSLVDLALLAGLALVVVRLLGWSGSTVPLAPVALGEALRALSVASSVLAMALALLLVSGAGTTWRRRRSGVAVGVAVAAALFLPYLVYWRVPFLAG